MAPFDFAGLGTSGGSEQMTKLLHSAKKRCEQLTVWVTMLAEWFVRLVTTPGCLICLSIVVVALGFGLPFWLEDEGGAKDWVTAMSASVVVAGFLFTAAAKFHADSRDRAFEFIRSHRNDKDLVEAFNTAGSFFISNPGLTISDIVYMYKSSNISTSHLRDDIVKIGAFLEDMAGAILEKEVNQMLLENYFNGVLIRFYEHIDGTFLRFWRNDPPVKNHPWGDKKRLEVLRNVEELYVRWRPRYERRYPEK